MTLRDDTDSRLCSVLASIAVVVAVVVVVVVVIVIIAASVGAVFERRPLLAEQHNVMSNHNFRFRLQPSNETNSVMCQCTVR